MDEQQFNQIIELQREKMKNVVRDCSDMFIVHCRMLEPDEHQFILDFIEYLNQKVEDDIKEWNKIKAWELGWSKKDIFYHLNFTPVIPLIYKHYFNVPEKDARKFKFTYKNLGKFLSGKYPNINIWKKKWAEYFDIYRRKLTAQFLNNALHYGDGGYDRLSKGIPVSVAGDLISLMRTFKKKKSVIEKLNKGEKGIKIASDLGVSPSTVSRIRGRQLK